MIAKGQDWGETRRIPKGVICARSDSEARAAVEEARRAGRELPPLGLLGGDLCRTLGGGHNRPMTAGEPATAFAVDLGVALVDGRRLLFVAHMVARSPLWTTATAAMNAEFLDKWDVAPRAHPGDGRLDVIEGRVGLGELWKVRRRLPSGTYLPHPDIRSRQLTADQFEFPRPLIVQLDGERVGRARRISVRVETGALTVFV